MLCKFRVRPAEGLEKRLTSCYKQRYNGVMAQYDEIIKHLMDQFSYEFARLAFNTSNVKVVAKLDTEQQTVKVHRNDMTFKVRFQNDARISFLSTRDTARH